MTKRCPDCNGSGYTPGEIRPANALDGPIMVFEGDECWECFGTGRVPIHESDLEAQGQERLFP